MTCSRPAATRAAALRPSTTRTWRSCDCSTTCVSGIRRSTGSRARPAADGSTSSVIEHVQRVWTSDMTDALSRQQIQRWTVQLVAPEYLGAHISAPTSHQTGRTLALDFRAATALFGVVRASSGTSPRPRTTTSTRLAGWMSAYKALSRAAARRPDGAHRRRRPVRVGPRRGCADGRARLSRTSSWTSRRQPRRRAAHPRVAAAPRATTCVGRARSTGGTARPQVLDRGPSAGVAVTVRCLRDRPVDPAPPSRDGAADRHRGCERCPLPGS